MSSSWYFPEQHDKHVPLPTFEKAPQAAAAEWQRGSGNSVGLSQLNISR